MVLRLQTSDNNRDTTSISPHTAVVADPLTSRQPLCELSFPWGERKNFSMRFCEPRKTPAPSTKNHQLTPVYVPPSLNTYPLPLFSKLSMGRSHPSSSKARLPNNLPPWRFASRMAQCLTEKTESHRRETEQTQRTAPQVADVRQQPRMPRIEETYRKDAWSSTREVYAWIAPLYSVDCPLNVPGEGRHERDKHRRERERETERYREREREQNRECPPSDVLQISSSNSA